MADLEDVTLDGRPLQSLRVADLKAALEERGLSKSGQKNALIKRLKGALMLENLQKTSTAHVGLQPNSQIGEEMSQNSFIKQYLAKQQELLRQRLEREAREAYETNDQEDHTDVNNSVCPPQVPDASAAITDHFKPPGPSSGQAVPAGLSHRHQEAAMSRPLASVSVPQDRSEAAADSDEEESEDGEDEGDGDDDDEWDSNIQRRLPRQPVRAPMARERSAASACQPQQQHIPSVLSPQLRQPTPPPSPPPELSFPLPDTPKQSPPSPDVAAGGRSPSSSSSGSSSSGSRSSSPEPHSGHAERKPGPLTLLARKMESEGAFSGAEWHCRNANRQDVCSSSAFPNKVRPEGLMSSVPYMLTASHAPVNLGTDQGHAQVPVFKATAERDAELEREKPLELQRQAQQRKHEQERAMEEERVRAALEREQQKALEKEQFEREQALERERLERELALAKEREEKEQALVLELQKARERELALQREQEEREQRQKEEQEKALELEKARILERERALEKERLEKERALEAERIERERIEREKALELERLEKERQEKERLEREAALERERLEREKEQMEREKALEQERIERERIEQLRVLERERIKREKALEQERIEQERIEREKAIEQERIARERALEQERIEREKALEQERVERERAQIEQERLDRERALELERIEREKVLEQERLEREKALELERLEQDRIKREKERIEQERLEREKTLELERIEREKAQEQERIEREKALEKERIEREKFEKEKALERERIELEKALERERTEKERALELERRAREQALELQRLELEKQENDRIDRERAMEQERIEREKALEQQEKAERKAALEREHVEKAEQERIAIEKERELKRQGLEEERKAKEKALVLEKQRLAEQDSVEKKQATLKENTAHERANESSMADVKSEDHLTPSRGCEIGFVPLPTPPPLSTGTSRKASTEADKKDGEVHGPVTCEGQAEDSNTPKSPQPVFKKFRFTRETPLQPQAASRVIKRPRTFSDTPQPCASLMSVSNADGQQLKEQSADLEHVAKQSIPDLNQVEAVESAKKEDATNVMSGDKKEPDKNKAAVKESLPTAPDQGMGHSSPLGTSGRDGNLKKIEKKDLRRSSSNDSSSSESDSASSSSTDSSSSSRKKIYTSRLSRDEKNTSPQKIEIGKVQKTSPGKLEVSSANTQINEGLLTKLNDASTQDDLQTKCSEDDEEKPENSCDGESAVSEPEKFPEANSEMPKAFSTRKISLSSSKSSPGSTDNEHELGTAGGRKRRWGSSTAVTAKKPSISITTDSLKSLIPDIKPALNQESVMELHPEEPVLSETEEEEKEDHTDQELQIRRTVTQIVHMENQEDGQKEAKRRREDSEEEDMLDEKETKTSDEDPPYTQVIEMPSPLHTSNEADVNSVAQSDILIRRSISQQKSGVSITIDDPVRTARQPSPPRGNVSHIVHVCNLVRPFTLGQLKELLGRTGTLVEDGFWIDKIKSHCYVTYSSSEEAVATRAALHGVKWPQSNPKVLCVDFCQQDELDFHKGLVSGDRAGIGVQTLGRSLPPLLPDRDQWVEREREMERRERARADREWDRDKVREFGKATEQREAGARRSRSRERRRKEREKSKEKKTEKKEKTEDPPAKLLDDLFRKTKAVPCIYWLPLTEEQYLQRQAARVERRKERELQRKKEEEEAELKMKEENKERMKPGGAMTVDRSETEKMRDRDRLRDRGRDRDRDREREADKRRDAYRRPGVGAAPSGRRSRSRSDPRERRR